MEETNRSQDSIKVIWEILPVDGEHIFREIGQDDIDPTLFDAGQLVNNDNFPIIPYPVFDQSGDCLDRVWTQTTIKINIIEPDSINDHENIMGFDIYENHKGFLCPFSMNICQEGRCQGCYVYLNKSNP